MRKPSSTFDLRAALSDEVRAAIDELAKDSGRKGVHACRVRLKQARALARVGHAVAPGLASVFNDSARGIMRGLAGARDLAALSKAAKRLAKRSKKRAAGVLKETAAALDDARETVAQIDFDAVNADLRDLLALAQVWPEASARQIRRGARRVARRARKAWREGRQADASIERRHTWRQREKDRLYASTLLEDAWPKGRRPRTSRNKRVVELLGREHDLTLLAQRLETTPLGLGEVSHIGDAIKAIQHEQARLRRRARKGATKLHEGRA